MTTTAAKLDPPHPPLARDAHGHLVAVPEGTTAWRICRQTTGRPREIVGPDKQPIRFPLETTCDELVAMSGRDVYRVYALDEVGKQLDYVTTLDLTGEVREIRNSVGVEPVLSALRPSTALGHTSDLRFALEAMAQMMRTNCEALRTVAESQVDLAKAIATAKGLSRNALLAPPTPQPIEQSDEPDEDDEIGAEKSWVDLAMPFVQKLAEVVPGLVMGKAMHGAAVPRNANRTLDATSPDAEPSKPGWELRDFLDWRHAAEKQRTQTTSGESPSLALAIPAAMQARVVTDPELMKRLFAIKAQLNADEIATLMNAIASTTDDAQHKLLDEIAALPVDQALALCRHVAAAIRDSAAEANH
jgi:hypothetical protein